MTAIEDSAAAVGGIPRDHRVQPVRPEAVCAGRVRYSPIKSLWFSTMLGGAVIGGLATVTPSAVMLFVISTLIVLLFGHSLGSHRKLIHDSYQCPRWLEYSLVYCGVLVGLAGPIGLLRQHELRDYAQRLPTCHAYLRHASGFWRDAWWQLHCDLHLRTPPPIRIEPAIANDRFYRILERTWMLQQAPWAIAFFAWGGWGYAFWGVCARVTAGMLGHWLIGYFAHNHGAMSYRVQGAAVQGRNIRWTSLLTMGECWHNNHHAYPGSAKLGLREGEWDPGWWVLIALRRLGLVWDMRMPEDLPRRPELILVEPLAGTRQLLAAIRPQSATAGHIALFSSDLCIGFANRTDIDRLTLDGVPLVSLVRASDRLGVGSSSENHCHTDEAKRPPPGLSPYPECEDLHRHLQSVERAMSSGMTTHRPIHVRKRSSESDSHLSQLSCNRAASGGRGLFSSFARDDFVLALTPPSPTRSAGEG